MSALLNLLVDLCLIGACLLACSVPLFGWASRRMGLEGGL